MENTRGLLLACVLLLALAITGPGLSVDARMAAEWNIPTENDADRPMNLSGNSVGRRFDVSTWNVPDEKVVDQPMNLSGNADRPMNLSGNSVWPRLEVQGDGKSAKENEEGSGVNISLLPGFDTLVSMNNDVQVRCEHSFPEAEPPLLVDETVHPGEQVSSLLYIIDPENAHVRYECIWAPMFSDQYIRRTVWADNNHQGDMPVYCVHCVWKVADDGIYLFNGNDQTFVFVSKWCTSGSIC